MSNWVHYRNGNYNVMLNLDNGTKIRETKHDRMIAQFPESFDLKICNKCNMRCPMCHENSTPNGSCGDILNAGFIDTLHPYTEIAIGGGNPLEHPDLKEFLYKCKTLNLVPSMTVHQNHFLDNIELLHELVDNKLIYGLGVSISDVSDELVDALQDFPNAVCHIIAGIADERTLRKLSHNNLKVLILGYKMLRRGAHLYESDHESIDFLIQYLYDLLPTIVRENWFTVVSFDNLALKQLNVARLMTPEAYSEFYMGNDGEATMYIDLVTNEFARSSTSTTRYPVLSNIKDMFKIIQEELQRDVT